MCAFLHPWLHASNQCVLQYIFQYRQFVYESSHNRSIWPCPYASIHIFIISEPRQRHSNDQMIWIELATSPRLSMQYIHQHRRTHTNSAHMHQSTTRIWCMHSPALTGREHDLLTVRSQIPFRVHQWVAAQVQQQLPVQVFLGCDIDVIGNLCKWKRNVGQRYRPRGGFGYVF